MYSEITNMKNRGRGIIFINFCVGFGKLYGIIMAFYILDSVETGNWRLLISLAALPCFITYYGVMKYIYESPRFLVV